MDESGTEQLAQELCQGLADGIASSNLGTVTTAIYDTAWLSMLYRKEGEAGYWVFPECLQYLLSHQLPNGGWEAYATKEDGILNSLAALLALRRHQGSPTSNTMLEKSIERAISFLETSLQTLEVNENLPVGFEHLVPTLLRLLKVEGIHFSFPAEGALMAVNEIKLKKFTPDLLYGTAESTLLHSLETFIGIVDFNKLGHRKIFGGMMFSPASTAAYLMNISSWDEDAEMYLRRVIHEGSGKGNGAVPCVFPTPVFEISWVWRFFSFGEKIQSLGICRLFQRCYKAECRQKIWVTRIWSLLHHIWNSTYVHRMVS